MSTITITSTFTDEQLDVVSSAKWYNPESQQSKLEFVLWVYEWMIKSDILNIYTQLSKKSMDEILESNKTIILDNVNNSIISTYENTSNPTTEVNTWENWVNEAVESSETIQVETTELNNTWDNNQ